MRSNSSRHRTPAYLAVVLLAFFGLVPRAQAALHGVEIAGPFSISYNSSLDFFQAHVGSICNHGPEAYTNPLRIELWAFPAPYTGGSMASGTMVASAPTIGELAQNQCNGNYDSGSMFNGTMPPSGTYHAVLFAAEYIAGSGNSYDYDDYGLVPAFINVSGGHYTVGPAATGCTPDTQTLCLDDVAGDARFQIRSTFQTSQGGGQSGFGHPVVLSTLGVGKGGLLWFFSAGNPEVLVKVLNGCAVNNYYWVFASAGTNVGIDMTVTDTPTGRSKVYSNPDLTAWAPVQDTAAFPCH
jgi:hypothetical protein